MFSHPSESLPSFSVLHVASPGSVGGLGSVIRLPARGQARAGCVAGASGSAGRPQVRTARGFAGGGSKNRLCEWAQERTPRRFDAVIARFQTTRLRPAARGVPADRLHPVRNAWETTRAPLTRSAARARLGLPPDGPVPGWVGRFFPAFDVLVLRSRTQGTPMVLCEAMAARAPVVAAREAA